MYFNAEHKGNRMKRKILLLAALILLVFQGKSIQLLIPMDEAQNNHLKSYGIAYWVLQRDVEVKWLLNYSGGSFLMQNMPEIEN